MVMMTALSPGQDMQCQNPSSLQGHDAVSMPQQCCTASSQVLSTMPAFSTWVQLAHAG